MKAILERRFDTSPFILSPLSGDTSSGFATFSPFDAEKGIEAERKSAILPPSPSFQLRPALRDFDGQDGGQGVEGRVNSDESRARGGVKPGTQSRFWPSLTSFASVEMGRRRTPPAEALNRRQLKQRRSKNTS